MFTWEKVTKVDHSINNVVWDISSTCAAEIVPINELICLTEMPHRQGSFMNSHLLKYT